MAVVVSGSRILEALQKARQVGRFEESFTIDGCSIVLQNLGTDDYESINSELDGLDDVEYLHAFQLGHLARSIVQIEGLDLRTVEFIEDEVPSNKCAVSLVVPSKQVAEKLLKDVKKIGGEGSIAPVDRQLVKLERHVWVKDKILTTWGREAITTAWRKLADVLALAEEKIKEGIQFRSPDETAEDKFRRLLGDVKELENDIPPNLAKSIMDEFGYMSKSSSEELEKVETLLRNVSSEKVSESIESKVQEASVEHARPVSEPARLDVQELMKQRQPLNRPLVAEQLPPQVTLPESALGRSAKIASIEDSELFVHDTEVSESPKQPVELTHKVEPVDPSSVIVDQPPLVGINPRFKPRN